MCHYYTGESLIMIFIVLVFLALWLGMLSFQCCSPKHYHGYMDIKYYAFCSNVIFNFPRWLIYFLFLNNRLVKLPITIVIGQIANDILFVSFLICYHIFHNTNTNFVVPILKIWLIEFVVLSVLIAIDFEIYCYRHKNRLHP